jgi:hypothetical protein
VRQNPKVARTATLVAIDEAVAAAERVIARRDRRIKTGFSGRESLLPSPGLGRNSVAGLGEVSQK